MASPAEPSGLSSGSHNPFPQVFGKYVLLRPMARGGMGELFLAAAGETGGFEKLCVVKKVLTELEDDGVRRRFLDEAKVVVRLNHANLVQVFDAGRVAEDHYLAMELVEGKDLRAVWNRCAQLHRRIPVDFAIFVIRELCRGLDYVHDAMALDLVHRDISPPNIMVSYHGQIKITDFGLATHAIKRELTNPGVVFGRYSYLSPEQARGFPADRRTDIYAAGIVLWEMLTGRQLFPADRHQIAGPSALAELRNPKIQAPSAIVPGVPDGLDEAVLRALAVEREDRFQTAGDFKVALSEVLNRHYPSSDVDQVAAFMRDIFQLEYKLESQDYASYAREDFSPIRAQASMEQTDTLSISDAIDVKLGRPPTKKMPTRRDESRAASGVLGNGNDDGSTSIELEEEDIVELRTSQRSSWNEAPNTEALTASATARVGTVVGKRYRVDRLLGVGGMGAVFAATHLALGKTYALKILHDVYGRDPDIIDRFMREARAATQTGHPNIIDVVDIGTTDDEGESESGDLYFVMELLEGTDLGTVIRQSGPLAIRRAVHIARQICKALAAAHEAGIIHRDLKSENVVLTVKGGDPDFVKVLDFGICKQIDTVSSSQTTPGMVMGSPDYMAPEQAAGASADIKSDIYALGTILFEMLTGHLPFTGRNAIDVLMKKGGGPAPNVTELRPEVPPPLAEVVSRCLARELNRRPESMRALEYELTRALEGRASAVAAVMGLQLDAETSSASGSRSRAGFHGMSAAESSSDKPIEPIVTVHDQAAARSAVAPRVVEPRRKPWLWLGLGAAAVLATVLIVRPELIPGLGSDDDDATADANNGKQPDPQVVPPSTSETGEAPVPPEPAETSGDSGEETAGETGELPLADTPDAIVARAEQALMDEHWRDPAAGSLAIELTALGIADPGNEAIGRLRRDAAKMLEPAAKKAAKDEDWATAVNAYRDLLAVWPDHEDGRPNFVDALNNLARKQRAAEDYTGLLATADELLNLEPKLFSALKYRADALAGLERWEDAVPAYRAAMRIRPSNKDAKKGYYRARQKLKGQQEG
ncbi:MAG TPA: protein kinase [Enhygromyxa sp.]|nr:protein kinase [Enhygromyxa sp.]